MIKKISIFIIVILAIIFIQPNLPFLQGSNSKTTSIKDNTDVAIYRNNPVKYFEILQQKQKANTTNISMTFDFKHFKEEFYKKDLFTKNITIDASNDSKMHLISKKNMTYFYLEKNGKIIPRCVKMKENPKLKSKFDSQAHILPVPEKNNYPYKFQYIKYLPDLKRSCSVWNYKTPTYSTECCIDEELGLKYYMSTYNYEQRTIGNLYKVTDIKIGENTDETFNIPKEIKFVINLSPLYLLINKAADKL